MTGTRKDNPNSDLPKPGEYGRDARGNWYGMTPNGHLANLRAHSVTEHEDGTITVTPSILVSRPSAQCSTPDKELWHGFLTKGEWKSC